MNSWSLAIAYDNDKDENTYELSDSDLEYIAEQIKKGFTSGELSHKE